MNKKPKVFLCVYACNPFLGSEHAVGWGLINAISSFADVWVVTEKTKNEQDVKKYLNENTGSLGNVEFYYVEKRRNRLLRKIWPPSYYWFYKIWHKDVAVLAKELDGKLEFDVFHQGTMVGFREPGFLSQIGGKFIWGPVGGLGYFPIKFFRVIGFTPTFYYLFYNIINYFHSIFLFRPRSAAKMASSGFLVASNENLDFTKKYWGVKGQLFQEIGIMSMPEISLNARIRDEPMRILWVGSLIPRKALKLALISLKQILPKCDIVLEIVGDGPLFGASKKFAKELGVYNICKFHGALSRSEVMKIMSQSHVLLVTSLRDLNSVVTIEGLASGLPVVAPDHCGFSDVITKECGFLAATDNPQKFIDEISQHLISLCDNEELRRELSRGATKHAENFLWSKKSIILKNLYSQIIDKDLI